MTVESLITQHIDTWTSAVKTKSTTGRGSSKKLELYGVKKLRELILELAVRGKLVPQDPNDEPASVLLERIAAEKAQLVKEKKIKRSKKLPLITDKELKFALPFGWQASRLGEFASIIRGITFPASAKHHEPDLNLIACLRTANVQTQLDWSDLLYIDRSYVKREEQMLAVGDIVMSMANSRELVGKVSYTYFLPNNIDVSFGGFLSVIRPYQLDSAFLMMVLRSPNVREELIGSSSQTTNIANISLEKLNPLVVSVPPLKEQHRIVAKVDELMALCDQLEQQTEASIEAHQLLVSTLLNTLTNSADADGLMENWARISDHFDILFTTEESIDQLKQTILQLAVMGKLVPQDPNDEPASVLLERIAEEKAQLIKEKKIKKQKALPPITDDEKPFDLPNGWGFAHMQDLCELITDGTHQTPKYTDTGRPFISAQCVKPFRFMPENCRYVSEEHYQAYIKNRNPEFRDILLSRVGAGIGEAAMIDTNLEFAIYVSTGLLKPHKSSVMSEYLVLWLNSPLGRGFSERNTLGKGVSQGNLNLSLIRAFVVSLPPLQEQRKIVIQVEKLSNLCNLLKERLQATQLTQLNLTDAIVEQAV